MPEFNPDKHYYGKPCKHGHESGMRYRKGGTCVECVIKQSKRWQGDNPERRRAVMRRWRKQNLEHERERDRIQSRKWAARNPETKRAWASNNPDKTREKESRRRSRKMNATPTWVDWDEVKYIYSLAVEKGLVVDHIVPIKSDLVCGLNCADNMRCIPQFLNQRKSNVYWPDMPKDPV